MDDGEREGGACRHKSCAGVCRDGKCVRLALGADLYKTGRVEVVNAGSFAAACADDLGAVFRLVKRDCKVERHSDCAGGSGNDGNACFGGVDRADVARLDGDVCRLDGNARAIDEDAVLAFNLREGNRCAHRDRAARDGGCYDRRVAGKSARKLDISRCFNSCAVDGRDVLHPVEAERHRCVHGDRAARDAHAGHIGVACEG